MDDATRRRRARRKAGNYPQIEDSMKALVLKLFLRPKLIGQAASALAGVIASFLISLLPNWPEFFSTIVGGLIGLEPGDVITQGGIVAWLTPIIAWLINAVVQEFLVEDNNAALDELSRQGVYRGPRDGWVGPEAKKAIRMLDPEV